MAHRDLGVFYQSVGDSTTALKHYTKTREFCSTSRHILDMCLQILEVFSIIEVTWNSLLIRIVAATHRTTQLRPSKHIRLQSGICTGGCCCPININWQRSSRRFLSGPCVEAVAQKGNRIRISDSPFTRTRSCTHKD